jgi:hypothetical protein
MVDLRAGVGRVVYSVLLILTLMISLICVLGFAIGSAAAAFACMLFCTLPLLIAVVGIPSQSKMFPIAVAAGAGSMVAFIAFVSLRDIFAARGAPLVSIIYEKWWWLYLALNFI